MTEALTTISPAGFPSHTESMEVATILAQSGAFPTVQNAAQAYACMIIGQSFGMPPGEALMAISLVQGKPSFDIHWQAARLRLLGHDYKILQLDGTCCKIQFYRNRNGQLTEEGAPVSLTMTDAQKIKVSDKSQSEASTLGNKWNYKSWAEDMLYAYCMRRVVRRFCPEVLGGYAAQPEEQDYEAMAEAGIMEGAVVTQEQFEVLKDELYGEECNPTAPAPAPTPDPEPVATPSRAGMQNAIMQDMKDHEHALKEFNLWLNLQYKDKRTLSACDDTQIAGIQRHYQEWGKEALLEPVGTLRDDTEQGEMPLGETEAAAKTEQPY